MSALSPRPDQSACRILQAKSRARLPSPTPGFILQAAVEHDSAQTAVCEICRGKPIDRQMMDHFRVAVCWPCKRADVTDNYKLISKTTARTDFLLTDKELEGAFPDLPRHFSCFVSAHRDVCMLIFIYIINVGVLYHRKFMLQIVY